MRLKRSYSPQKVRPIHINRFRGITLEEQAFASNNAFVVDSFNSVSKKLRLLESREGQRRSPGVDDGIFDGDIIAVLSAPRVISLAEGSRVWVEPRNPFPNASLPIDQVPDNPQPPVLEPPDGGDDDGDIDDPPPPCVCDPGGPVGPGPDDPTVGDPPGGGGEGNPDPGDPQCPDFDPMCSDDGGGGGPKYTCDDVWVDIPFKTGTILRYWVFSRGISTGGSICIDEADKEKECQEFLATTVQQFNSQAILISGPFNEAQDLTNTFDFTCEVNQSGTGCSVGELLGGKKGLTRSSTISEETQAIDFFIEMEEGLDVDDYQEVGIKLTHEDGTEEITKVSKNSIQGDILSGQQQQTGQKKGGKVSPVGLKKVCSYK